MFPLIFFGTIAAFFLSYYALLKYRAQKAEELIARLWAVDKGWDIKELNRKMDELRNKVLGALEKKNAESVRALVSDRLYEKMKGKSAEQFGFRKASPANILLSTSRKLVDVADYNDDSKDRLGLYISYTSFGGRGSNGPSDEFWVYVRNGSDWIVGDIIPNANIKELARSGAYSEALTLADNVAKMEAESKYKSAATAAEAAPVMNEELQKEHQGRREYRTGRRDYH